MKIEENVRGLIRTIAWGAAAGLFALAVLVVLLIARAHAAPSPAALGLDKTVNPGNLSVQDTSGAWVPVGAVNSSTHSIAIPNASLANPATTVGGATCTLGSTCAPATTINGTACTLGSSCSLAAPTLLIGTTGTSGGAAGQLMFDSGSVLSESAALVFTSPALKILSNTASLQLGASADVVLLRDGAGVLSQRNGANKQTFGVYGSFTSGTFYERGVLDWNQTNNVLSIGTQSGTGGGATLGQFQFVANGVSKADFGVSSVGFWTFSAPILGTTVTTTGTVTAASITTSSGSITAATISAAGAEFFGPAIELTGAALTASAGHINLGGTTAVSSNCGTLASSAGCMVINVGGTQRYVPYY